MICLGSHSTWKVVDLGCKLRETGSRVPALLYWKGSCELRLPEYSSNRTDMSMHCLGQNLSLSVLAPQKHNSSEERRVLWVVSPHQRYIYPEAVSVIAFGKSAFADGIYLRISACNHPGFGMGPTPNDSCPYETEEERHKEKTAMWKQRQKLQGYGYKPRNTKDC